MPILSYNLKRICRILASKYKIHTYQGVLLIKKHFICDFKNPANTLNGRTTLVTQDWKAVEVWKTSNLGAPALGAVSRERKSPLHFRFAARPKDY